MTEVQVRAWRGLLPAAAVAVSFGVAIIEVPVGLRIGFLLDQVVSIAAGAALIAWSSQASLKTARALSRGQVGEAPEVRQKAGAELALFPDRVFWILGGGWLVAGLLDAGLTSLLPQAPSTLALQVAYLAGSTAPLASLFGHLFCLSSSRQSVADAVSDLGPNGLLKAIPARQSGLRRRLIVLTASVAFPPVLLTAGYAMSRIGKEGDLVEWRFFLAVGIALFSAIFAAVLAGRAISSPLRRMVESERSELVPAEGELWALSASLALIHSQLGEVQAQLSGVRDRMGKVAALLLDGTLARQDGAAAQGAALSQTSATTEELARSATGVAMSATAVAAMAQQAFTAAESGQADSEVFFQSIVRMREGNQRIADAVLKLNKRVQQVGKVVSFIDEVGDKADLLALNAELEGNKAGEVGRGFSLVAAEMRRLAESVLRSTKEIRVLIEEIRDGTNSAVMSTESGLKAMEQGSALATSVKESFVAILDLARQTSDAIRTISLATQQQQTGTDQLAEAMAEILGITNEGRALNEQLTSARQALSKALTEATDA